MLLSDLRQCQVLVVGGKGGVGKTTVASALALAAAVEGDRVLLVSTDPAHNLGQLWGRSLSDTPTRLFSPPGAGSVDGVEIDVQLTVDRHLAAVGETMQQLLPERMHAQAGRHLDLAREAPGSHESAVLERVADAVQFGRESYDLTVFDTAPTGHTLRLLSLPEQLGGWAESLLANRNRSENFASAMRGLVSAQESAKEEARAAATAGLKRTLARRRERFGELHGVLTDRNATRVVLVTIPEAIPARETLDLAEGLGKLGIATGALVVNRRSLEGDKSLSVARSTREEAHVAFLASALVGVPNVEIPIYSGDLIGVDALGAVAERFVS